MSEYNIQMNKYNALNAEYDQLYPATKIKNVDGLNEALQNNDPRRWGLGKDGIPIVNKATLDGLFIPGWYMFYDENNTLDNGVRVALVEVKGRNTSITSTCVQEIWTQDITYGGGLSYKAERLWDGSKWQPFEWFTPPMLNGIEYRTTERWLGHPVYVKVVDFGAMTDGKSVEIVKNPRHVVRCSAVIGPGNGTLPDIAPQALSQSSCFTAGITQNDAGELVAVAISKIGTALGTSTKATVAVWYTKLTD